MKSILLKISIIGLLFFCHLFTPSVWGQKKVSILGDSYSTYYSYVTPDTNYCWYRDGKNEGENDVSSVKETWWHLFIQRNKYTLEKNNSFSGSTVCHTGYHKADYKDRSFVTRMDKLGNPDIILVFGGTNDSWAHAPIGDFAYTNWNDSILYNFRPAFACLMKSLKELYPNARIYNITNSELSEEVTSSMDIICKYYKIPNIQLQDIAKQHGHPSKVGMKSICKQIENFIKKNN